ncbi:MAG: hypothetical protein QM723_34605 [Myxococcaceae bacterium]
MGVDSIKPGGSLPVSRPQTDEVKSTTAAEATQQTAAAQPQQSSAPAQAEGFDDPKKKLVSVTGGYKAFTPSFPVREDLQAQVASARVGGGVNSAPLQDKGGFDTSASKGQAPAARTPDADFAAQAKAAGAKTPAQIEAKAIELGKAKIAKDFGMTVKDGDTANWTSEQLSRAYESFKSMPKADQAKLKGLDLIREAKAPPASQAEMGKDAVVAGEYNPNVKTTDGKRDAPGSITAYDAAFPSGPNSRQESISVLTHEAGHAVEGRDRDDAMAAKNEANDVRNAAVNELNPTVKPLNDSWKSLTKAEKKLGSASLKDKPKVEFIKAQNEVQKALVKLNNAKTPDDLTKAQATLTAAKAKRDTAMTGLSGSKSEVAAQTVIDASDKVEETATNYAQAKIKVGEADVVLKAKSEALDGVATHAKKKHSNGQTSNELDAYKTARGKEKPVSTYGAKKTPEGYAEAYSLYMRDPSYMQQNYPKQYQFFHDNHRSPNDP